MGTQNSHPVVSSTPCPLHLLMCVSVAIQGASQILVFGDLWQRENCILTLPAGIPHDMCTLSLLLTLLSLYFPRLPSTAPFPRTARLSHFCTAPHHPLTSSANVLPFWCISSMNRLWWQTGKGWKLILGEGRLPLLRVSLFLQLTYYSFALTVQVLHQSDVVLWYTLVPRTPIRLFPWDSFVWFSSSTNIKCKSSYPSISVAFLQLY